MGRFLNPSPRIGERGQALSMRHIVLSDDGYNVVPDAYHRLLAACYFPESPRDQAQGLYMAALEQAEFDAVGPEAYRQSQIMQATSQMIRKRTARYFSVGFVAVSFVWLKINGRTPSLNRASIMAACAANEFNKITWWNAFDPFGEEKETAVTSDPSTVESIFREYRSVAHICAASVSAAAYLDNTHLWDQSPEVVASVIQTCASFQNALESATDTSTWNMWDVKKHFPAVLGGWPVLVPDDDLFHWLERGYAAAIEQGLIKEDRGGRGKSPGGT